MRSRRTTVRSSGPRTSRGSQSPQSSVVCPSNADFPKKPIARQLPGQSRSADAVRQLRTNLQLLNIDNPPRVLVISSSVPGEGKITTAIALAIVLAQSGRHVALAEGDLRRAPSHQVLDATATAPVPAVHGDISRADRSSEHAAGSPTSGQRVAANRPDISSYTGFAW